MPSPGDLGHVGVLAALGPVAAVPGLSWAGVDLILDGGATPVGIESTVVDMTGDRPRLLRPGTISREDLEVLLRRSLAGMQRIHQIVQELRYFAHDAGPELGWLDVDGLLEASLSLVRHEIKHRATVTCDFAGGCQVFSDANKLSQVFLNLLVNASQALEHGDPDRDVLRVGTTHYQDYVLVFVEDTGVGMTREVLARIFEPFFTTRARGQGTGLGLAISRDILRSLGGDVRVFSEPERGSRFELVLPVRAPHLARQDASLRESGSYQTPPRAWAAAPSPSDDGGAGEGH